MLNYYRMNHDEIYDDYFDDNGMYNCIANYYCVCDFFVKMFQNKDVDLNLYSY